MYKDIEEQKQDNRIIKLVMNFITNNTTSIRKKVDKIYNRV